MALLRQFKLSTQSYLIEPPVQTPAGLAFASALSRQMDTHIAAGTDIWTALAATSDDEQPPKSGCLGVLAVGVLWALFA